MRRMSSLRKYLRPAAYYQLLQRYLSHLRRLGWGFALRRTDISNLRSICLMLGPHRNLSTLSSGLMFLHPNCQVLEHGEWFILGRREVDFMRDYSRKRLQRFVRFAIDLSCVPSQGPESLARRWTLAGGHHGGSLLESHAFGPQYPIRKVFERSGGARLKPQIQCLLWKGSLRVQHHLQQDQVDIDALLVADKRLRFLLPVRNPLDVTASYMLKRKGLVLSEFLLAESFRVNTENLLDVVLGELHWALQLQSRNPKRVFVLYQHALGLSGLDELRCFLGLDEDPRWLENCREALQLNRKAEHSAELMSHYRNRVSEIFDDLPEAREQLLNFAPPL